MNLATRKLSGVRTMTIREMVRWVENMKYRVSKMVTSPENSWVNPRSSPSEIWSTSAITRWTRSPVLWLSKKDRGSCWIRRMTRLRISRTVLKASLLLMRFMAQVARLDRITRKMIWEA